MSSDAHFGSEVTSAELNRRSFGDQWAARLVMLLVSVAAGMGLVFWAYGHRVKGDEVALGDAASVQGKFNGRAISAFRLEDYPAVYAKTAEMPLQHEWLWLGNSNTFAINDMKPGEKVVTEQASDILGFPVLGLHLPNQKVIEMNAVVDWALTRRHPERVIVPVYFQNLRHDGYREGMEKLLTPELAARMEKGAIGRALLAEMTKAGKRSGGDMQGTTRATEGKPVSWLSISLQDKCEKLLEDALSRVWPVWAAREDMYAAMMVDLYKLRNKVLRINPSAKRAMLKVPYEKNMSALRELIASCKAENVPVTVYVPPLRSDVPPPYDMNEYAKFKKELRAICIAEGAQYADVDGVIQEPNWGTSGEELNYKHMRAPGHRIMAEEVIKRVRSGENSPE